MKIETQNLEDHQVKLTVEVEPEVFEDTKRRAARKIARHTKIPGFRPGKAPYQVVVRQIGEASVVEEAMEMLVNDVYPKAIEETGIHPYGPGQLENVVSMEPPVLEFVVPLEAEVELGDYHALRQPYELKEVSDEEVEAFLESLRDRQAVLEPVERSAQEGDMVFVRLSAERKNGEEGEEAALIEERPFSVLIKPEDEADQDEWPFPGFSRQLIGRTENDEVTFSHTFSEESDFESLRGVEAEFHVKVESVKSRTLPELNDEFAASLGEFNNLEELRAEVRSSLEQQAKQAYEETYDEQLLDQAIEQATMKYPPQMVEHEVEHVIENLQNRLEQQNLEMDLYLKSRDMDMEALKEEARPVAESRLKRSLYLYELANAENIEVEPEELQNETMRTMNSLSQSMSEKEMRKLSDRNVFSNLVGSIMADMLSQKAMNRLRDIASGKLEEEATAEEAATQEETSQAETEASVEPTASEGESTSPAETTESQAEVESEAPAEEQATTGASSDASSEEEIPQEESPDLEEETRQATDVEAK